MAAGVGKAQGGDGRLRPGVDPRLDWFLDAGFGLFLHWGAYSVAGVEASWPIMVPRLAAKVPQPAISEADYVALAGRFDPRGYDPRAWVETARRTGMRYIVLTAKHHDGYCLFDAPGTDYKSKRGPSGRDLCAELAEACERAGMPLGFYYSPPDMHHPGYRDTSRPVVENWTGEPERSQWSEYLDYMEAHLRKLLTDYGHVAVVWFDGLFDHARYEPERFHRLVRELSPTTLMNDRLGPGDYTTPEQVVPRGVPVRPAQPPPDLDDETFRQVVDLLASDLPSDQIGALLRAGFEARYPTRAEPAPGEYQPWETCMTLNGAWAWVPTDTSWKSPESLVRTLVDVRSRGGNLLLNVGPTGDGVLPPEAVERLAAVGGWMDRHGEAIHGVTFGPVQDVEEVRTTRGDDAIFLALTGVREGRFALARLPGTKTSRIVRLGDSRELPFRSSESGLEVDLPAPLDPWVDVLALRDA